MASVCARGHAKEQKRLDDAVRNNTPGGNVAQSRARASVRYAMYAIVVVGLIWVGKTVRAQGLWEALSRVPFWAVLAGALCAFVNMFGKGTIWWLLLPTGNRPRLLHVWAIVLRAGASSIVMPLRAGEGLRVWWLMRRSGLPMAHVVAIALAEKLVNLVALVAVVSLAASVAHLSLSWVTRAGTWLFAVVALACLLCGLALGFRRHLGKLGNSLALVSQGGRLVWALSFLCATLGWLGDCTLVWLMAHGVGAPLPPMATPFVLLAINVAIALPGTPGHVGTMEFASMTALTAFGATREAALSFALLYHGVQVVAVLSLTGLHLLWCSLFSAGTEGRATMAPPQDTPPDT